MNVHSHVHLESIWHFVNLIVQEQSVKAALTLHKFMAQMHGKFKNASLP